jgi:NADH dehydrogenase [ubiquinone] 1 alpha subcomplex assembly factor 5
VQKSYEIILDRVESGFYERQGVEVPDEIVPVVVDEECWNEKFEENQLDLIVNHMTLHWVNRLDDCFKQWQSTLEPDGVFMSASYGGSTLQEVRISFNLAEQERDGGVSPVVSPLLTAVDLGNIFARAKFTMPTVDLTHTLMQFSNPFALFDYLQTIGEQSSMHEGQRPKS